VVGRCPAASIFVPGASCAAEGAVRRAMEDQSPRGESFRHSLPRRPRGNVASQGSQRVQSLPTSHNVACARWRDEDRCDQQPLAQRARDSLGLGGGRRESGRSFPYTAGTGARAPSGFGAARAARSYPHGRRMSA
jgi:hypothetical protein